MSYRLIIPKPIQKHMDTFPTKIYERIVKELEALKENPRPHGSLKLRGFENEYRIRIGDYRVRYHIDDAQQLVSVIDCDHRKDVYKD